MSTAGIAEKACNRIFNFSYICQSVIFPADFGRASQINAQKLQGAMTLGFAIFLLQTILKLVGVNLTHAQHCP